MDRSKKVPMEEVEATRNAMVKALDVINQRRKANSDGGA
jgi:hypothetical protein